MSEDLPLGPWVNDIHQGDAAETLGEMPESSVHMAMTSPPYYRLRDYGVDGQFGQEDSVGEYVENLVDIGRAIRRVLRDDGSWWLNLGDGYATKARGNPGDDSASNLNGRTQSTTGGDTGDKTDEFAQKCKMLVPQRVAIALIDDGWILRNDIVWKKKGGGIPEPVDDRASKSHELLYHLVPADGYWYDKYAVNPDGKAPNDVWEIFPKPHPDAHFAVFPDELAEKPLKLTCPPTVCADCGTPYERRLTETSLMDSDPTRAQAERAKEIAEQAGLSDEHLEACRAVGFADAPTGQQTQTGTGNNDDRVEELAAQAKNVLGGYFREFTSTQTVPDGWKQTCDCETDATTGGVALDPFVGSGTLAKKAKDLGRRFVGVELNPEYVAMAQKRAGVTVDEPERLLEDGETALTAFADGGDADE